MSKQAAQNLWESYKETEVARLIPVLRTLGYTLNNTQPHTEGERYLLSGKKLVLLGTRIRDALPVVIKVSSDTSGKQEIEAERRSRHILKRLRFAYSTFTSPEELHYKTHSGLLIFITAFIPQDLSFMARPIEEQFRLALTALKTQEGVHATTHGHLNEIGTSFPIWTADTYLNSFETFVNVITENHPELVDLFTESGSFLRNHRDDIERYCGFLTHSDFVPHNFRINQGNIYLLDYSSIRFGSKHESWARFLNFMTLYNPTLERWFMTYMEQNRSEEERLSLRLMRIYKLGFLLAFYAGHKDKTESNLRTLTETRISFWSDVLKAQLQGSTIPDTRIATYIHERDRLRSPEEKQRQKDLH